jgi:predicted methyltransferase
MRCTLIGLMTLLLSVPAVCATDAPSELAARIKLQLSAPGRDQYDAAKDPGRHPVAVAEFARIETGMTALDMITGAGYNAEILSAAVGPSGIVYAQNSHAIVRLIGGAHHKAMLGRLANKRLRNVRYIVVDTEDMPFDGDIDIAFWGMNMHDIYNADGAGATLSFLEHVKHALKPGGIFVLADHIGVAGRDNAELHRIEPRIVIDMVEQAGFVVEEVSDLLGNPDDDHSQSVYADGLRYATDRILIRARKPAN